MNTSPSFSVRDSVNFHAAPEDLEFLYEWYDGLKRGEVKAAIQSVRYFPFGAGRANEIVVFCRHSFFSESLAVSTAHFSGVALELDRALSHLVRLFQDWIKYDEVDASSRLFDRPLLVRWWPLEMMLYISPPNAPQAQAQMELNTHALDCLELIRFATLDDQTFLKLWHQSNEPFLAAGRIATGGFEWISSFPEDWLTGPGFREELKGRINEYAREYAGLFRMALALGHRSPLTDKLSDTVASFRWKFCREIPKWRQLAINLLDASEELQNNEAIFSPEDYELIDQTTDHLRQELVEASNGLEHFIPAMVNSFLPMLSVPESAFYFKCEIGTRF